MRFHAAPRRILGILFIVGFIVMVVGFVEGVNNGITSAVDSPCPAGTNIAISSGTTTMVSGVVNIIVGNTTSTAQPIYKVIIFANGQPIGLAQPNGTYSWNMPWVTSLTPNGSVTLNAKIYSTGTVTECTTPNINAFVQNPTPSALQLAVNPTSWEGPLSFSFPVTTNVLTNNTTMNLAPYALYQWTTTIGNISPQQNTAQFSSGQTEGTGTINVTVKYGGAVVTKTIPITVKSPNAPLPTTPTTTTDTTTTTTTTTTDAAGSTETTTIQKTESIQNNPIAQSCVVTAVGQERYDQINSGAARPTPLELSKLSVCFAPNNFILPSNFAPVAPAEIKQLKINESFKVAKLENVEKKDDNGTQNVLKISGTAKPKSTVVIYVFSDPLVLTTTADDDGNWTYTLEDPIEPGEHEVYSVVDRGDGVFERSNPFSFIIGTAEAADANPSGLSLQLAETPTPTQSKRGMLSYIIASAAVLVLVVSAFFLILKRQSKKAKSSPADSVPATGTEPQIAPATDDRSSITSTPSVQAVAFVVNDASRDQTTQIISPYAQPTVQTGQDQVPEIPKETSSVNPSVTTDANTSTKVTETEDISTSQSPGA